MSGQIFYRERGKMGKGEKRPRFRLVAIAGLDMKVYGKHLRKVNSNRSRRPWRQTGLAEGGEGKQKRKER